MPDPTAGPGEVVAKVAAVGLNFYDTLIIAGRYQRKPPFPFSPGGEFAGVVESVGAGVTGLARGDRVIGYVTYGAARERIAVAAGQAGQARHRSRSHTRGGPRRHLWDRVPRPASTARRSSAARRWRCSALPAASGSRRWRSASSWARA